jgi:hypothetical protein
MIVSYSIEPDLPAAEFIDVLSRRPVLNEDATVIGIVTEYVSKKMEWFC